MRTIKFITSYEDIISRIPGLFAYIELDENGVSVIHKATDSPMGCYGKVVENIKYADTSFANAKTIDFGEDGKIEISKAYSYKTLMGLYYKYLNAEQKPEDFGIFKTYMEKGIGKIKVELLGVDKKECDLVPEYIYLATVRSLYEEMAELQAKHRFYEQHMQDKNKKIDRETELDLCCKSNLYKRKGGDKMLNYLGPLIKQADEDAERWRGFAVDNEEFDEQKKLTLRYPINLYTSERDMGVLTPLSLQKVEDNNVTNIELTYTTNSKLNSLRRFKTYLNMYDEEERPGVNKDWLFYYRVGQICNLSVLNDDYGNISTVHTKVEDIKEGDVIGDLMAFGDIITDITFGDKEKPYQRSLKFTYWTDVHLKATCNKVFYDDDNNKKVTYDEFVIDEDYLSDGVNEIQNHHGIKYVETYYFDDESELNSFFDDKGLPLEKTFKDYVNGENDIQGDNLKLFEKYEFTIYNNIRSFQRMIDYNTMMFSSVVSDDVSIKIRRRIEDENEQKDIIRLDFYEGISYSPTENIDVKIDRGMTSIFDRHIRFSEVKTLQDMEEYMNGSFFNIQ